MLTTTREDLSPETVVKEYKRLQEVASLFNDLKHFVDVHPVRHWLESRRLTEEWHKKKRNLTGEYRILFYSGFYYFNKWT